MDKLIAQLEQVLRALIAAHAELQAVLRRKLAAVQGADRKLVVQCCELENAQVQRISEMEKQRLVLVAELTRVLEPKAAAPMRLRELAELLPEPARSKLMVLRAELVRHMQEVQSQAGTAKLATETLLRHMQGLVQSVSGLMTGTVTYSNRGRLPVGAPALSTFSATA